MRSAAASGRTTLAAPVRPLRTPADLRPPTSQSTPSTGRPFRRERALSTERPLHGGRGDQRDRGRRAPGAEEVVASAREPAERRHEIIRWRRSHGRLLSGTPRSHPHPPRSRSPVLSSEPRASRTATARHRRCAARSHPGTGRRGRRTGSPRRTRRNMGKPGQVDNRRADASGSLSPGPASSAWEPIRTGGTAESTVDNPIHRGSGSSEGEPPVPIRSSGDQRRRRLGRDLTIAALGLLLGVGGAFAVRSLTQRGPESSPSHLALPGLSPAAAPAGPAGAAATNSPSPTPPVRPGSARAALAAFLGAQAKGDFARGYALLDRAGRARYPTVEDWVAAQDDRLQPTTWQVGAERAAAGGAVDVRADVLHRAGGDPFSGLTPGRTDELWRLRREQGAWRVAADPLEQVPVLPSDRLAPAAVQSWLDRLAACDQAGAARLEAGGERYGPQSLAQLPCRE